MMNDRFSAELRQHLLGTANERPADGQLAAVVEKVATTGQQRSFVARLTWYPGRIGRFPATALRYGLVVLALVAILAGVILAGGSSRGPGTVFEGTWTAADFTDGSTQTLVVDTGTRPAVHYVDDFAMGSVCRADAVKVFTADGTGTIVGDRLDVEWPDGGSCGLTTIEMGAGSYVHDAATDLLVDGLQANWFRVRGGPAPPTRGPAPDRTPAPTLAPEDSTDASGCVDLANGGSYSAPVGPLSVTATIPDRPAIPWQGIPGEFYLSARCGEVAPIGFYPSTATAVYATSCMPTIPQTASFAESIARLDIPTGADISDRVDLTIGGHAAARYDIVDLSTCPDGFGLWHGTALGQGETGSIYVIDVDGVLMAIELNRDGSQTQAELEEVWGIIESLQIEL